jgi:hypothetical protein
VFAKALGEVGEYRLAAARRDRPDVPQDMRTALERYLDAKFKAVPSKPDESEKLLGEWLKLVKPENRLDAVGLLWDLFRQSPPSAKWARACVAALDELKSDREFSETVLLRWLAAWDHRDQLIEIYPRDQVVELLRAEEELSRALALGPHEFERIREQLDRAKEAYQAGQKLLFEGAHKDLGQAGVRLKEAADGFVAAGRALASWQKGVRDRDAAVAVLLDTMPSVLTASDLEFDAWVKAVNRSSKGLPSVEDPFAVPPGRKEPNPLPPRTKPADLLPYERLVAGTALPADSRRKVWDLIRADRRKFHEGAREQDAADDAANDRTTEPTPAAESEWISEDKLAVRRATVSVELLKLAGHTNVGELDAALGRLKNDPSEAGPLGQRLRKAWTERLSAGARVVPPGATRLRSAPSVPATAPSAARDAARAYRQWVYDQLLAEQAVRPRTTVTDKFYEKVTEAKHSPD